MNCSKCNAVIPEGSRFCIECGTPVANNDVTAPAATTSSTVAAPIDDMTVMADTAYNIAAPQTQENRPPVEEKKKKDKKKKSKKGLCIALTIIGIIAIAAVIIGLFFRGLFLNLILGNKKYAALVETKGILYAIDTVTPDGESDDPEASAEEVSRIASEAIGEVVKQYRSFYYTEDGELSSFDLGSLISTYNEKMNEAFGTNGARIAFDVDMTLTETAKSALGIPEDISANIDEVLKAISDMSFSAECAASTEAMQVYLALSNTDSFNADAKLIAHEDGTIYFTLPFATEKGIMIKLETGEKLDELELAVELENIKKICTDLAMIYLNYFSDSEVTIEKGEMEAAGVSAQGRLIVADLNKEKIGEMVAEMIDYISESEYLTESIMDIINYCNADYTEEEYKTALADAAQSAKDNASIGIRSETVVDYNNNILAKSYTVTVDDKIYGASIVNSEDEIGTAITDGEKDVVSALILKSNDTSGKIHFKLNTGIGALIGLNFEYTDVQIVQLGNTDVIVGDFHIYLAGTKDSKEKGSAVKAGMKFSLENDIYTGSLYLDAAQYGNLAINSSVAATDVAIGTIPDNALDITNIAEWTLDNKEEIQYLLDMLADLRDAVGIDTQAIYDLLIDPLTDIANEYLEGLIGEYVPIEDITALADLLLGGMDNLGSAFDIAVQLCPDELVSQVEELYGSMSDCYDEIVDEVEMIQEEFDEYVDIVDGYIEDAEEICAELGEIAENAAEAILPEQEIVATDDEIAQALADGIIGAWKLDRTEMFGKVIEAEETSDYSMCFFEDGNVECVVLGAKTTAVWSYDGSVVTIVEKIGPKEIETTYTLEDGQLVYNLKGIKKFYSKMQ